ncbi:hexosaminidase [Zhouia amylolytica]|uniref:beta-N-acetylhexosaminidase n=1 Tax=Zhouia amylolytica TaxID=376730 RepID=A0A1I6P8G7_9FLAO|nr:family 20 glycosylhydrolase [Zhouia amylolytica]MCQ0111801.1 family 20 glycosylhydrolase [Zhouia amylolytica]SFS36435.1 hexosaminidase [Zhouia amylolytica]
MKKYSLFFLSLLLLLIVFSCTEDRNIVVVDDINIIPQPNQITPKEGHFFLSNQTSYNFEDLKLVPIADHFKQQLKELHGLSIGANDASNNMIEMKIDSSLSLGPEGYHLEISKNKIGIAAPSPRGVFYGLQSLLQMLPMSTGGIPNEAINYQIPATEIIDEPAFKWRGLMLDVSRHFYSVAFIKKHLDILSMFKINKFHWHLTDDQGWRMEIKAYPKLTEIGSKRKDDDGSIYGGYYTQEEIKDVVNYARERFIDVVPEFDIPGHMMAALASYPNLACTPKHYEVRTLWGVETNILCAGKEDTYTFMSTVIDEMATMFPYEYYHMGGDETPTDKWKLCSLCQQKMKQYGLANEHELKSYVMAEVEKMLHAHDKKMIGWDEILEGGITSTTNIMSWQGEEGGIKAANAGHDVIMTPSSYLYLNFYQGDLNVEPMAFGGDVPLKKVYQYDPIPHEIEASRQHHILGAQANVWTEYVEQDSMLAYLMYPRAIALSESLWSREHDYEDFLKRLNQLYPKLDALEVNYHIPLPEGPETRTLKFLDSITIPFHTTQPVKMVYTTDGTSPTMDSQVYEGPFTFKKNTTLKIASVLDHGKVSLVNEFKIVKTKPKASLDTIPAGQGLEMSIAKGIFNDPDQINPELFKSAGVIDSLAAANKTYYWGHSIDSTQFKAVILEGMIEIPEEHLYTFSSLQDRIWIGDSLVIDNANSIRKHPKQGMIALQKGFHKLQILYINNIKKGWATDWNTVELQFKKNNDSIYRKVKSNMLYR